MPARYSPIRRDSRDSPTRMRVPLVIRYGCPAGATLAGAGITRPSGVAAGAAGGAAPTTDTLAAATSSSEPRRRVVLWRCLTSRLTSGPFL